jgi:hypothetical protein
VLVRQTAAFFLLLSFLAQTFSKYVLIADYLSNTAAFAQKCVNKDKPSMHCNGKCQLCKKMEQQENPDKQAPERKSGNDKNDPLLIRSGFSDLAALFSIPASTLRHPDLFAGSPIQMPRAIFHPPGLRSSGLRSAEC